MIYALIRQMSQMLKNLQGFLDQGEVLSKEKSFDASNLLQARLAPDMFNLIRQVQASCDTAKFAAARLSGKEAPKHEDNEETLEQLRDRVSATLSYLEGFKEADFEGALTRKVTLPFRPGFYADGQDYLVQFALPNFYFHTTSAYAILRNNGVELGKLRYIGHINMKPVES